MTHSRKRDKKTPPGTPEKTKKQKDSGSGTKECESGGGSRDIRTMMAAVTTPDAPGTEFECNGFQDIGRCFQRLNSSLEDIRESVLTVRKRVDVLENTQTDLSGKFNSLEEEQLAQDLWARKWNLRIFGLRGKRNENAFETEQAVRDFFLNSLKMDGQVVNRILFQASHRLPSGPDGKKTIIVRLVNLSYKDMIFEAARKLAKDSGISIAHDLPKPLVTLKKNLLDRKKQLPEEERKTSRLKFYKRAPFIQLVTRDGTVIA